MPELASQFAGGAVNPTRRIFRMRRGGGVTVSPAYGAEERWSRILTISGLAGAEPRPLFRQYHDQFSGRSPEL